MRLHREGLPTLTLVGGLSLFISVLAAGVTRSRRVLIVSLGLGLLVEGFFAQFFRHPVRHIPPCTDCVISPADGKIVAIETVYETEYFKEERLKVSIYMSALNVHVNRVPIDGEVVYRRYHPGKYLVAFHPKSSELNERNTLVIEDDSGRRVLIRQIAGLLARRIVCYPTTGEQIMRGDELGFIKFGSRCDVFLPTGSIIRVNLNEHVKGGETILAEFGDSSTV